MNRVTPNDYKNDLTDKQIADMVRCLSQNQHVNIYMEKAWDTTEDDHEWGVNITSFRKEVTEKGSYLIAVLWAATTNAQIEFDEEVKKLEGLKKTALSKLTSDEKRAPHLHH